MRRWENSCCKNSSHSSYSQPMLLSISKRWSIPWFLKRCVSLLQSISGKWARSSERVIRLFWCGKILCTAINVRKRMWVVDIFSLQKRSLIISYTWESVAIWIILSPLWFLKGIEFLEKCITLFIGTPESSKSLFRLG